MSRLNIKDLVLAGITLGLIIVWDARPKLK
jgi:hypothetical protein